MRTIIAGSRGFNDYELLKETISSSNIKISVIISGGASGVDKLGERYALENNIPLEIYPADWNKFGKAAGPIRNKQMAENAEAAIIIWDGLSPGTANMIDNARYINLVTHINILPNNPTNLLDLFV